MQTESDFVIGPHYHMCPECFSHDLCEMDCSWSELTHKGLPDCHPVICDQCEKNAPRRMLAAGFDPIAMGM